MASRQVAGVVSGRGKAGHMACTDGINQSTHPAPCHKFFLLHREAQGSVKREGNANTSGGDRPTEEPAFSNGTLTQLTYNSCHGYSKYSWILHLFYIQF